MKKEVNLDSQCEDSIVRTNDEERDVNLAVSRHEEADLSVQHDLSKIDRLSKTGPSPLNPRLAPLLLPRVGPGPLLPRELSSREVSPLEKNSGWQDGPGQRARSWCAITRGALQCKARRGR